MKMSRGNVLKLAAGATAGLVLGGGAYMATRESDPLEDHVQGTTRVLTDRFGGAKADGMVQDILRVNADLDREMPDIGGEANIFTEWLVFGVYYLAVYEVLKANGQNVQDTGKVIFDTFQAMADYPRWMLRLVGALRYNDRYLASLREAAVVSQERRYPGDWVLSYVEGDGDSFDYGFDITECGICKYYEAQGASELAPYLCLSDYVVSEAFDRGLVRYKTVAEGHGVCDFRYQAGRETYVHPLRDGWPPQFSSG